MSDFRKKFKRDKRAVVTLSLLLILVLLGLVAPLIAPYSPTQVFDDHFLKPPFWVQGFEPGFWLGTDEVGRDELSRLIFGARVSLWVGFMVVVLALSVGTLLGLLAGYFEGWVDAVISRAVDVLMSLPSVLLAVVMVSILGPNLTNGILAVSIVALPGFIRVVRSAVLAEKNKSYVLAVRSFGANHARILIKNIFPNILGPLIVQSSLSFSDGILNVAALGFLGLGAQAPTPEWGVMLADSKPYMESASWLVTLPGLCILVVVVAFNLLGDGLRDVMDPKLR